MLASALLLIDHQIGTMQLIKNLALEQVQRHTLALAKLARLLGMPVVLASSEGRAVPRVADARTRQVAPRRVRIASAAARPRQCPGQSVCRGSQAIGRQDLIMANVTTDVRVVFPAIRAQRRELGFRQLCPPCPIFYP